MGAAVGLLLGLGSGSAVGAEKLPITRITISLPKSPDPNVANWVGEYFSIEAKYKPDGSVIPADVQECRILVQIKQGGEPILGTYTPATAPRAEFSEMNRSWTGRAALALIGQTSVLSPGKYEVSVQFFEPPGRDSGYPISPERTQSFVIKPDRPVK